VLVTLRSPDRAAADRQSATCENSTLPPVRITPTRAPAIGRFPCSAAPPRPVRLWVRRTKLQSLPQEEHGPQQCRIVQSGDHLVTNSRTRGT